METARYVYNFTCVDLLNVVLIAINWFGQSHASSPEMTRIAKIAFCHVLFVQKQKEQQQKQL